MATLQSHTKDPEAITSNNINTIMTEHDHEPAGILYLICVNKIIKFKTYNFIVVNSLDDSLTHNNQDDGAIFNLLHPNESKTNKIHHDRFQYNVLKVNIILDYEYMF